MTEETTTDTGLLRLLHTKAAVEAAKVHAEQDFLARIERHGLTVLPATRLRWWGS